jgi:hypothetical protein
MGSELEWVAALSSSPSRKLSARQAELLTEIISRRAPRLADVAHKLTEGSMITNAEADELEDVLASAMLEEGYDADAGLSRTGIEIDEIIGITRQFAETFFKST